MSVLSSIGTLADIGLKAYGAATAKDGTTALGGSLFPNGNPFYMSSYPALTPAQKAQQTDALNAAEKQANVQAAAALTSATAAYNTSQSETNFLWWVGGGSAALVAYLILKKKKLL